MNDLHWVPIAATLALGLSVAGLAYWLASVIDAVPPEDRSYRDRPPTLFRLFWWPIQIIAHYLGPVLPVSYRQRLIVRLRLAGLDYAMSSEQLTAGRLLLAIACGLLVDWVLLSFDRPPGWWPLLGAAFGYAFPAIWLRDRIQVRRRETLKTLPFFLDIITLCVEAGLNLTGALTQAVAKGPVGPLRDELARVLRDVRAGRPPHGRTAQLRRPHERAVDHQLRVGADPGGEHGHEPRAHHAGPIGAAPRRALRAGREAGDGGPGQAAVPADRIHLPVHLRRAGIPDRDEVHPHGDLSQPCMHRPSPFTTPRASSRVCWGLLGRARLQVDEALYLAPCSSVHTVFMGYAIDVAFVDREGRVMKLVKGLKPYRAAGCWGAAGAVEFAAGGAARHGVFPGITLAIHPTEGVQA